jgi:plastocyanin
MRNFEVRMRAGQKFNPDSFEIQAGDTVTWLNEDDSAKHSATPDDDSPITFTETDLASGKFSRRITFNTEGSVKYHCKHHPGVMKGTITVTAVT